MAARRRRKNKRLRHCRAMMPAYCEPGIQFSSWDALYTPSLYVTNFFRKSTRNSNLQAAVSFSLPPGITLSPFGLSQFSTALEQQNRGGRRSWLALNSSACLNNSTNSVQRTVQSRRVESICQKGQALMACRV